MTTYSDRPRVLLVEDDPNDIKRLQEDLQDKFSLLLVGDFDLFKVKPRLLETDIALVDLYENTTMLPKGLDVIKEIGAYSQQRRIPIIIMSVPGRAQLEDVTRAMENGFAYDFIWKTGPRAATKDELNLKITSAYRRAFDEASERKQRRFRFRVFQILLLILAIGTVVGALLGSQAATLSFQALLVVLTLLTLPLSNRYL